MLCRALAYKRAPTPLFWPVPPNDRSEMFSDVCISDVKTLISLPVRGRLVAGGEGGSDGGSWDVVCYSFSSLAGRVKVRPLPSASATDVRGDAVYAAFLSSEAHATIIKHYVSRRRGYPQGLRLLW